MNPFFIDLSNYQHPGSPILPSVTHKVPVHQPSAANGVVSANSNLINDNGKCFLKGFFKRGDLIG